SDPTMWRDILLANREEVLRQTLRFRRSLDAFEQVIAAGNGAALQELLRAASDARAQWQMGAPRPAPAR
ncbi:MAG TPA: prephenate dehydrogenase/arogenate dehydrogenase family protein, partial [Rubrivivax sp.]|nr:prephenate dehydrogenase/arogenate dehydrogenase family protein [Rubrivivax sp.]